MRSGNGPNLVSAEMEDYLNEIGVKHRLITPLWPGPNGEVVQQNHSFLKAMRVGHAQERDWRLELNKFLLAYYSTPHTTTSKSPTQLLYGRKMFAKLPEIAVLEESEELGFQQTRDCDVEKKQIGADYVEKRHHAAEKSVLEGDLSVFVQKCLLEKEEG